MCLMPLDVEKEWNLVLIKHLPLSLTIESGIPYVVIDSLGSALGSC